VDSQMSSQYALVAGGVCPVVYLAVMKTRALTAFCGAVTWKDTKVQLSKAVDAKPLLGVCT